MVTLDPYILVFDMVRIDLDDSCGGIIFRPDLWCGMDRHLCKRHQCRSHLTFGSRPVSLSREATRQTLVQAAPEQVTLETLNFTRFTIPC